MSKRINFELKVKRKKKSSPSEKVFFFFFFLGYHGSSVWTALCPYPKLTKTHFLVVGDYTFMNT